MRTGHFDGNNRSRRTPGAASYGSSSKSSHRKLHSGRDKSATTSEVDEYPLV
jgi:hypothetical protein